MEYTKGDWEVKGGVHLKNNFYAITNVSIPAWEVEANAHLIAAAPELLEACKMIVRLIEGEPLQNIKEPPVDIIRRAIAKAEKQGS